MRLPKRRTRAPEPEGQPAAGSASRAQADRDDPLGPRAVDVVTVVRRLGRMKLALTLFVALSVAAGTLAAYDVTLRPFKIEERRFGYGTAGLQILLDARISPLRDAEADLTPLAQRAQLYASFLQNETVRKDLARELGVAPGDVALTGAPVGNPRALAGAGSAQTRANALTYEGSRYRLLITPAPGLPIIAVSVLGPNGAAAARLAQVARRTLVQTIARDQERGPELSNPITATAVGSPVTGEVSEGSSLPVALAAGAGCMLLLTFVGLLLANVFESLYRSPLPTHGG